MSNLKTALFVSAICFGACFLFSFILLDGVPWAVTALAIQGAWLCMFAGYVPIALYFAIRIYLGAGPWSNATTRMISGFLLGGLTGLFITGLWAMLQSQPALDAVAEHFQRGVMNAPSSDALQLYSVATLVGFFKAFSNIWLEISLAMGSFCVLIMNLADRILSRFGTVLNASGFRQQDDPTGYFLAAGSVIGVALITRAILGSTVGFHLCAVPLLGPLVLLCPFWLLLNVVASIHFFARSENKYLWYCIGFVTMQVPEMICNPLNYFSCDYPKGSISQLFMLPLFGAYTYAGMALFFQWLKRQMNQLCPR